MPDKPVAPGIRDPNFSARIQTIEQLANADPSKALAPLVKALEDPDWLVRGTAARLLGKLHPPKALPALRRRLTDKDLYVRLETARALCAFGPEAGAEVRQLLANRNEDHRIVCEGLRALAQAMPPVLSITSGRSSPVSMSRNFRV